MAPYLPHGSVLMAPYLPHDSVLMAPYLPHDSVLMVPYLPHDSVLVFERQQLRLDDILHLLHNLHLLILALLPSSILGHQTLASCRVLGTAASRCTCCACVCASVWQGPVGGLESVRDTGSMSWVGSVEYALGRGGGVWVG